MAWTQSDLDKLDVAIANNVRRVSFADGRSREFHSPEEMLKVRREMKAEIAAAASRVAPRRVTVARLRRGK